MGLFQDCSFLWCSLCASGPITGRAPAPLAPRAHHHAGPVKLCQETVLCLCRHQPASLVPITTLGQEHLGPFQIRACSHNAKVKAQTGPPCPQTRKASANQAHCSTRAGRATGSLGCSRPLLSKLTSQPSPPLSPNCLAGDRVPLQQPRPQLGPLLEQHLLSASHFLRFAKPGYE